MMLAQALATVLDQQTLECKYTFGYRVFYGDAIAREPAAHGGCAAGLHPAVGGGCAGAVPQDRAAGEKHFRTCTSWPGARDVTHWQQAARPGRACGARELFESSLRTARTVLDSLAYAEADADALAERFRAPTTSPCPSACTSHNDHEAMIAVARQGRQQLVEQLAKERQERMAAAGPAAG